MRKNEDLIDLSGLRARNFLLKQESYCTIDLPKYFTFNNILKKISNILKKSKLSDFYSPAKEEDDTKTNKPKYCEDVNYKIIHNKNGQYSWRSLELIHPAIYTSLVHEITDKNNWNLIVQKLRENRVNSKVDCYSMPKIPNTRQSYKAAQINCWLEEFEKKSIALFLNYEYLFLTDIVDCYGSIYTHAIPWAIHTKEVAKSERSKELIGNKIDLLIQDMCYGQTNGIPQGSVLMDFIAEIVLSYVDLELTKAIKDIGDDYTILRYRDDYRIFSNNPQVADTIIKKLTNELAQIGMKLSTEKSKSSDDIVFSSIKEDKLFHIINGVNLENKEMVNNLIRICDFAEKFPNSGGLIKLLQLFYDKMNQKKYKITDLEVAIAVLVKIAYKNPKTYPQITAILSQILNYFSSENEKKSVLERIMNKLKKIPNSEILNLHLQRVSYKIDPTIRFNDRLCNLIYQKEEIWCSKWLKSSIKRVLETEDIIDRKQLENSPVVVERSEFEVFKRHSF